MEVGVELKQSHLSDSTQSSVFNSLTIAALGVAFGDIGTSPLYAVREAFHGPFAIAISTANIMGVLSLILWSLILVITIKYLAFVMKAHNNGEGGVLALTALAFPLRNRHSTSILARIFIYLGLFGSALLVGDGMITPAISVLSAVEGLEVATPFFKPYVIPITLAILGTLFFNQYRGTARIGAIFGPIVLAWFITIGSLGIAGIYSNPSILQAINPMQAINFFIANGIKSFIVLGAVFLVITGGEALYADMGHFGKSAIQKAWFFAAFPSLLLNYFGQGAVLLNSPADAVNPFFRMAPEWALYPLVALATMATVVASQAVISGVFSLTRQAVQLGYAPRFRIIHTSKDEIGQIYIPLVNWALFIMTCWLVLEFKSSSALASAYGIAVATTMVITTILACSVALRQWRWSSTAVACIFVFFFSIDFIFLGANFSKIEDGGWFPITVGIIVFTLMTTWHRGRQILYARLQEKSVSFADFYKDILEQNPTRVKGTAFFMTGDPKGTPPALLHNLKHNKVLHEKNVLLTVIIENSPHVAKNARIEVKAIGEKFYRIIAHYGFMDQPTISDILHACLRKQLDLKLEDVTFFLGRETLIATSRPGMALWREKLFAFMSRNAERATAYFDIPAHQVVEVGIQVEL